MAHEHDDEHEHDHGNLSLTGTEVADDVLAAIRDTNPEAARLVESTRQPGETEKAAVEDAHNAVLSTAWVPGFHEEGDTCAVCGEATPALFTDTLAHGGRFEWAAFAWGIPVHPQCAAQFREKYPRMSRRDYDVLTRRHLNTAARRPSPETAVQFRRDLATTKDMDLGQWVEDTFESSVPESPDPKALARDLEKLGTYVHTLAFH